MTTSATCEAWVSFNNDELGHAAADAAARPGQRGCKTGTECCQSARSARTAAMNASG